MAIEFKSEEKAKLQNEENKKAKKEERRPIKIKDKTPFEKWSRVLFVVAIIGVVYSLLYIFTGLLIGLPVALSWIIWLCVVGVPTLATIGLIWFSEGWRAFNRGFMDFNNSISSASEKITQFMYNIFPFLESVFGICIIAFLFLSIIGFKKEKDKYKHRFIWGIILIVLFILTLIIDIILYTNK